MPSICFPDKNPAFSIHCHAKNNPHKIAIIDDIDNKERTLSYASLENRIGSLTSHFIKSGVKSDDCIAIVSRNRIEVIECFFAAMRLGAIPFCINPSMPSGSIESIFQNAVPSCIFIEALYYPLLTDMIGKYSKLPPVIIGKEQEHLLNYKTIIDKNKAADIKNLFNDIPRLLVYTSGSTGMPKGVVHKFSAFESNYPVMIRGVEIYQSESEHSADPKIVSFPMFHASGLSGALGIKTGATIVIQHYFDPQKFLKSLEKYKLKICYLLPSMLALCLKEKSILKELNLSQLKAICLVGSPCATELILQAKEVFRCIIHTSYGMTEGGAGLTFNNVAPEDIPVNSCGMAPTDGSVKLVDTAGNSSHFGELWVKNTLFSGYYKQPDLTDSKHHDGWFMTGDLFYRDEKGFYFYRGRKDDMFICDGKNIYPLEIENILSRHNSVFQVCTVALDHPVHGQIPVAMISFQKNKEVPVKELHKYYRKHGSLHSSPRYIYVVDSLPTLGSGKIDRKKVLSVLRQKYREQMENKASNLNGE